MTTPPKVTVGDALALLVTWVIACVFAVGGALLSTIQLIETIRGRRLPWPEWVVHLFFVTTLTVLVLIIRQLGIKHRIVKDDKLSLDGFRKGQNQAIWIMRLSFFLLVLLVIQALAVLGYMARLTHWFKQLLPFGWITENFSFGVTFFVAAIISGVVGNASYALLKRLVK